MQKTIVSLCVLGLMLSFSFVLGSLNNYKDSTFTFHGIDFRQAKMIGSHGFTDPQEIKNSYLERWNTILLQEQDKYDLKSALGVKNYRFSFDWMTGKNDDVDEHEMVINESYELTKEDVIHHVSTYDVTGEGVGVVFNVESLNKLEQRAYVWVTFFDLNSKKVLLSERMNGQARGIGLRNYWANSFYDIINQIKKVKRKKWFSKK